MGEKVIGGEGRLFTVVETCDLLAISSRTLWRIIAAGEVRTVRVGPGQRQVRVTQRSIERYIKDRLQKVPA